MAKIAGWTVKWLIALLILGSSEAVGQVDKYEQQRKAMVERQLADRDITDRRVLEAMAEVPRHVFVDPPYRHMAYADHPLPIGNGQTISQPYIVALMTQLLDIQPDEKVLEIGTGSGYQAAVLAQLEAEVYTVEIIEGLAKKASATLTDLGYDNIHVKWGDGSMGWEEAAPFDAAIITCATPEVPESLFRQIREGGRIVVPLGDPLSYQTLTLIVKREGKPKTQRVLSVRFVPMTKKKR
jgi:protein-L-isoaspartate(D-aspartate) O-methyltransferase